MLTVFTGDYYSIGIEKFSKFVLKMCYVDHI